MIARFCFITALWWCVGAFAGAADLERHTWHVGGVEREAWLSVPAGVAQGPAPVVFVFHGHGGNARHAAATFRIHQLWPEAIVVYPQGLKTSGALTDPEGKKAGWTTKGDAANNRDLKFFDAMLAELREKYHVDDQRIYATGHSNGGSFTYLLWAERGDEFAAFAPSASVMTRFFGKLNPKPLLHIGSPQDGLVKFTWQQKSIEYALKLNGGGAFKPDAMGYTEYPSSRKGPDTAVFIHRDGHAYPSEAPEVVVKFFKAHAKNGSQTRS